MAPKGKVWLIVLAVLLIAALAGGVIFKSQLSATQDKLAQAEKNTETLQAKLDDAATEAEEAATQIETLQTAAEESATQIETLQTQLDTKTTEAEASAPLMPKPQTAAA